MVGRFDQRNNEAVEAYYMADYYGSTVGPSVSFINNLSLTLISIFGSLLYLVGSVSCCIPASFPALSTRWQTSSVSCNRQQRRQNVFSV